MRCIDADAYIKYINTALSDALNGATTPSGIMSAMTVVKAVEADMRNEKITPTIEPERKTGKWVLHENQRQEDVDNGNYLYVCSECGKSDLHAKTQEVPFCWWCGTKMKEGGQE